MILFLLLLWLSSVSAKGTTQIVHMDVQKMPLVFETKAGWYESYVGAISGAKLIYVYNNTIEGFAVRLMPEDVERLLLQPGVISVFPELHYKIMTTRSPFFLGLDYLEEHFPSNSSSASDVIIGVIDTGIWPESQSFRDKKSFGPPPRTWKGGCEDGTNFTAYLCNQKLIGARFFLKGFEAEMGPMDHKFKSPRDFSGHGTHVSSIVAGSVVKGATFLGYATGVSRGMARQARVAMYKACWSGDMCMTSDILAAIDKAIDDNVNILSISLGYRPLDYDKDGLAIGALAAIEKGIFVSAAAGNSGPKESSVTNMAPWITTVGAGTLDRDFPAIAILGNGKSFAGVSSLFKRSRSSLSVKLLPLVYAILGGNFTGKLVLVDMGMGGINEIESHGALGMIYANTAFDGRELLAKYDILPSIVVGKKSGDEIRDYVLTDSNPTAMIKFKGTVVNVRPSPVVAGLSSRGPNSITPDILKPDLIAPGVNILAAWTKATAEEEFNILSGTSMSCPHLSGLAALLKAAHPEWSPAAIRSAFMTTANSYGNDGKFIIDSITREPSTPFAYGAGHVSPVSALNPGFIYDLTVKDYLDFLCASNYTSSQIRTVARRDFTCDPNKYYRIADLNYPSFMVRINISRGGAYKYTRVATNVGGAGTYSVKVFYDKKAVNISVEPPVFNFKKLNEKKSYTVTFTVNLSMPTGTNSFGSIEWSDGRHVARSPVALSWI